jgi:hypothetical protein
LRAQICKGFSKNRFHFWLLLAIEGIREKQHILPAIFKSFYAKVIATLSENMGCKGGIH